jgi:hypothetical protein
MRSFPLWSDFIVGKNWWTPSEGASLYSRIQGLLNLVLTHGWQILVDGTDAEMRGLALVRHDKSLAAPNARSLAMLAH